MILGRKPELWTHLLMVAFVVMCIFVFLPSPTLYKVIFTVILIAILSINLVLIIMKKENYLKLTRLALVYLSIFLIIVCLTFYTTKFLVLTDGIGIGSVLGGNPLLSKLLFLLICFLQPIVLPLPEALTVPAGSAVFGSFTATYLSFFGTISGIAVMFFIARIGGQRLTLRLVKEKHLQSYQKYMQKNETAILFLLFVIPILPDEIICLGSGIGGVSFSRFILIASLSKLMTASSLSYSVELAKALSLTGKELISAVSLAAGGLFILSLGVKWVFNKRKIE
ncbi:TVP38/TMEM64 family protein [Peribacillus simplex]|uniref:TVP38/TMEM64 family membrane protein n=1 Tax=Peribacillus simplex TaxID=1478 RepID=A0A9W4L060_9BACI|nr:VTT domain-containing protein [Peribacillus simplex]MDR4929588.1 VTT domain-containing protein [Peribacillus simplex]WHX90678.1 VTT domain-containing protein [Peribacillus simplex]CAH0276960.1 TVP38/TMEM64 family inner membrane protein YdjZ [Peribacillus simplex]